MSERSPLFSIIIPTRDRDALLEKALRSVLAQSVDDYECIVVDDFSARPVQLPEDSRFRLLRNQVQSGFAASSNSAIAIARGRYLTFLDDDDFYTPCRLELALQGLASAPIAICWRANPATGKAGRNRMLGINAHHELLERPLPVLGQVAIDGRSVQPFEEQLIHGSDLEWLIRVTEHTAAHTTPEIGLYLQRHSGPRLTENLPRRVRNRLMIPRMHPDYFESHPSGAAFFYMRTGMLARRAGDKKLARRLLVKSLRLHPLKETLRQMAAAVGPSTRSIAAQELELGIPRPDESTQPAG